MTDRYKVTVEATVQSKFLVKSEEPRAKVEKDIQEQFQLFLNANGLKLKKFKIRKIRPLQSEPS